MRPVMCRAGIGKIRFCALCNHGFDIYAHMMRFFAFFIRFVGQRERAPKKPKYEKSRV
jgi:hypothetical protein